MSIPLKLVDHERLLSADLAEHVQERTDKLGHFFSRIKRCRVVVDGPGRHELRGRVRVRVYVTLPDDGTEVEAGQPCGEVESTKSVSDVYAPVSGVVVTRNADLDSTPELVNTDPYGEGWLIRIRLSDPSEVDALQDAATYRSGLDSQ